MTVETYRIAEALFWLFAAGVAFLPPRWALLSLILVANVDVMAPEFASASTMGWENAAKTVVLPALLLLRLNRFRLPRIQWTFPARGWAALVLYAAFSALWSPFKLSALKMVAYLACYFVLYLTLSLAWRKGLIDDRVILLGLWGSLALACVTTYALDGPFTTPEVRFTSFVGPQAFAFYLLCTLSLLLFSPKGWRFRRVSVAACLLSITLTGSRFTFLGVGLLLFVAWLRTALGARRALRVWPLLKASLVAGTCMLLLGLAVVRAMPRNRLNELLDVGSSDTQTLQDIGTFGWRLMVYDDAASELSRRSLPGLIFGSGTSSGAGILLDYFGDYEEQTIDANRALHDEFIRTMYEWGFVGLFLGLILLGCLASGAWRLAILDRFVPGFAVLGIVPGALMGLLVENVLAAPSTPLGIGFLLVLTYGFSANHRLARTGLPQVRVNEDPVHL